jgi:hypothetical protein
MATLHVMSRLQEIVKTADPSCIFTDNDSLWDELDASTAPAARSSNLSRSLDELRGEVDVNCSPLKRYRADDEAQLSE